MKHCLTLEWRQSDWCRPGSRTREVTNLNEQIALLAFEFGIRVPVRAGLRQVPGRLIQAGALENAGDR